MTAWEYCVDGPTMKTRYQLAEDEAPVPIEGLEVEEAMDDDTIRRFMREWRRRVGRELAQAEAARRRVDRAGPQPAAH